MEGTAEELPWRILEEESKTRMSNDRPAETSARPLQETSGGSATTDGTSARQWLCGFASVVRPNVGSNVVTGESMVSTGWSANAIKGRSRRRAHDQGRGSETQVGNV